MVKPICVKCQRFYKPKRTGTYFTEQMPLGNQVPPGKAAPERWQPYKLWCGDLWECQGCGNMLIVGTGSQPVRETYHPDFKEMLLSTGAAQILVNDC